MFETEITINKQNPITGTLALPESEGKFPAILIIAGSGPLDRDGNTKNGKITTNLYKELAHFYTGLGFATLRFDKVGTGQRGGEWVATGFSELVNDAKDAMIYLAAHPNVDDEKIIICGHSEGAIIATAVGETMNPAGIMFLSGGVDNLIEATRKQRFLAYKELFEQPGIKGWLNRKLKVDEKSEKQTEKFMEKVRKSDKDVIKVQLFFKQPAKWFREHEAFNKREALKNITCPVFAIIGDKDVNADPVVLSELSQLVQGPNEYHVISNMEHGLRIQQEPKNILNLRKNMKEILTRPIHEEALEKMSDWLTTNFKNEEVDETKVC